MVKHVEASYYENGVKHSILARDLGKPDVLDLARSKALVDPGDELTLFVRGGKTPHFYTTSKARALTEKPEVSAAHNKRIAKLLKKLVDLTSSGTVIEVGTTMMRSDVWQATKRVEQDWHTIGELQGYTWKDEVTRALSDGQKCRHDLFGANLALLNFTDRNPWVAIEVIDTHYPSDKSFDGFLEISARLPLVVLFDLVAAEDYFLEIDEIEVLNTPPPEFKEPSDVLWTVTGIRSIFYIHQGKVWQNNREARFKETVDGKEVSKPVRKSADLKKAMEAVLAKAKSKKKA
jgi:hypothetical protein